MPNRRRLFSEAEISDILKRAATLQTKDAAARDPLGLTVEELEQVARDAGLDPKYVTMAIADLDRTIETPDEQPTPFWGAPTEVAFERVVDVPFDEEAWVDVVQTLRKTYKKPGTIGALGSTREWTLNNASGRDKVRVELRPAEDQTRLRVVRDLSEEIGGMYGGLGSVVVMASLLTAVLPIEAGMHPGLAMFMALSIFVVGMVLTRWGTAKVGQHQQEKTREVMHELERRLDAFDAAPAPSTPPRTEAAATASPPLDASLDEVPEPAERDEPHRTRQRTPG